MQTDLPTKGLCVHDTGGRLLLRSRVNRLRGGGELLSPGRRQQRVHSASALQVLAVLSAEVAPLGQNVMPALDSKLG